VANAGVSQEANVGDWAQLDGSASSDPDGDQITYMWYQVEGPAVRLDDPASATPGFIVPPNVDLGSMVFELVVSDGELFSEPDQVALLVHAPSPDEGTGDLLGSVQGADLNPGHGKKLEGLLEDAIAATDCATKLGLIEDFIFQVEQGQGHWLDDATAAAWLDQAQTLADEVGPCTTSCREDGGIEGSNLALDARIASSSAGTQPQPTCLTCPPGASVAAVIDGDDSSAWIAPGWGQELIVDLGAKEKVTGIRVVSPYSQTYRLEAWNNLTRAWEEVAHRTDAVAEGVEDICDTATRFVRYINESTDGSPDTWLSELQVFGHRSRQARMEWLGTDAALEHEAGHAEGTSWVVGTEDGQNVVMSTGPHARVTAGKRWVKFWIRTSGDRVSDEPVGSVLVVREVDGQVFMIKESKIPAPAGAGEPPALSPITMDFTAEVGSRYSFEVQYRSDAELILDKIVVKDHPGLYTTEALSFKVEGGGRRFTIDDGEHVLNDYVFQFQPGSLPDGTIVRVGLGQPFAPVGVSSPLSETVGIAALGKSLVPLSGQMHIKIPIDHNALQAAGIGPQDAHLIVQTAGGTVYDLGPNFGGNWQITPYDLGGLNIGDVMVNGNGLDIQIGNIQNHPDPGWVYPEAGPTPPEPTGFTADYADYNLFHFALDDAIGSGTVEDSKEDPSEPRHNGTVSGNVDLRAPGYFGAAAHFDGGHISVDIGEAPKAFAFEAWVKFEAGDTETPQILVSQEGNFRIEANPLTFLNTEILRLYIFDEASNQYRLMASNAYDLVYQSLTRQQWHHVVVIYDGHFKGRIYVDGFVNTKFINRFEGPEIMNTPYDPTSSPGWPRTVSSQPGPVVIGALIKEDTDPEYFHGLLDRSSL
ncbi:MAG TPA: LamG-like jellyroll fold domain-containing protein, partial [Myxococcota bacterium]|nr:LamG-like jellyroll fold domain-containing protein [Myxococcota bacterium]